MSEAESPKYRVARDKNGWGVLDKYNAFVNKSPFPSRVEAVFFARACIGAWRQGEEAIQGLRLK